MEDQVEEAPVDGDETSVAAAAGSAPTIRERLLELRMEYVTRVQNIDMVLARLQQDPTLEGTLTAFQGV